MLSPAHASALPAEAEIVRARSGPDPLAARAARRERRAFEQIYERYHQELYRYCLSIVRRREDAEDALQATMAAALRSLPGERREVSLRPWLYRVAHNESISLLRQSQPVAEIDHLTDPLSAPTDELIADRDRLRRLVADLRSLPERQSSAIVMRELSGLSYEEIGAALSTSEAGARQTVYEARVALRNLEEGREMECDEVRRTISDRDRRRLRGRKIRSHIETCDVCRGFAASIQQRRSDLGALFPPIPAVAATAMLSGLVGGSGGVTAGAGAGTVATGGVAGAGLAGSAAVKGASVLAAVVLAAGAAEVGGVIKLPLPAGLGGAGRASDSDSSGSAASQGVGTGASGGPASHSGDSTTRRGDAHGGAGHGQPSGSAAAAGEATGKGIGASGQAGATPGQAAGTPGQAAGAPVQAGGSSGAEAPAQPTVPSGQAESSPGLGGSSPVPAESVPAQGENSPGTSGTASGETGGSLGNSGTGSGETGSSPGNSGSAPGHTGSSPGKSELAPGHTGATGGNSASAPGHTGATGGNSAPAPTEVAPGNSGSAPGHTGEAPGHSGGHGVIDEALSEISGRVGASS